MKDLIKARHRDIVGSKFVDWPTVGPEKWVHQWQRLMHDSEIWNSSLFYDWAGDFNLVWGEVLGTQWLRKELTAAQDQDDLRGWDIFKAGRKLEEEYKQKSIRSGMKIANRGKTTRGVFNVQPQFNGKQSGESPQSGAKTPTTPKQTLQPERSRSRSKSRKRAGTETTQKERGFRGQKKSKLPCWGCMATAHEEYRCPLILDYHPGHTNILPEWREAFEKRMEDKEFSQNVSKLREARKIRRNMSMAAEAQAERE
jgi:hypothetical protein